jgi:hypothetical protein
MKQALTLDSMAPRSGSMVYACEHSTAVGWHRRIRQTSFAYAADEHTQRKVDRNADLRIQCVPRSRKQPNTDSNVAGNILHQLTKKLEGPERPAYYTPEVKEMTLNQSQKKKSLKILIMKIMGKDSNFSAYALVRKMSPLHFVRTRVS